jgi:hypothetical protein
MPALSRCVRMVMGEGKEQKARSANVMASGASTAAVTSWRRNRSTT